MRLEENFRVRCEERGGAEIQVKKGKTKYVNVSLQVTENEIQVRCQEKGEMRYR